MTRAAALWKALRCLITSAVSFLVWILFTGDLGPFSLVVGAAGSLGIGILTHEVFLADHDVAFRFFLPRPLVLLSYLLALIVNLYRSSARMLAAIARGGGNPRVVYFRTKLKSDLARMVLANSITFTPGTITLDLDEDHLTVHWFFASTTHSTAAGEEIKGRAEAMLGKVWI